jgi:hypothetical protein
MMLRIADWAQHFETSDTRRLKNSLAWVRVPTKMGPGYAALVDHANGAAHFGVWMATVEIAAVQEVRGVLPRAVGPNPHDVTGICRSVARIARLHSAVVEEALLRLIHEIQWVEEFDVPAAAAASAPASVALVRTPPVDHDYTPEVPVEPDLKRTTSAPPSERFHEFWALYPRRVGEDSACRDWCSYVTTSNEEAVFACLRRYLLSRDVKNGAIKNAGSSMRDIGWIATCGKNNWADEWPAAEQPKKESRWARA